jgi:type IV secretory pathway VirJ component
MSITFEFSPNVARQPRACGGRGAGRRITGVFAIALLAGAQGRGLTDLPLVEAKVNSPGRTMAIVMSGDGNWAGSVQAIAKALNGAGISVVGIKSREYLSSGTRTPENVTRDMERILGFYLQAWQADTVLLIGYSRGADILPFVVNRLPPGFRARVGMLALVSPGLAASFEFHFADLFSNKPRPTDIPLAPEVARITDLKVRCMCGADDESALCPRVDPARAIVIVKPGGHHLDKDFDAVGAEILAVWQKK